MIVVAAVMPPLMTLHEVAQSIRAAGVKVPVPRPEPPKRSFLRSNSQASRTTDAETPTEDGLRLLEASDMHLLIAQFGNLTTDQALGLAAALREARWSPVELRLRGATVLDSAEGRRSIWADLEGDLTTLSDIAHDVTRIAQRLGYRFDRRVFQPRIRVATLTGKDAAGGVRAAAVCAALDRLDGAPWVADHVSLMKKSFDPQGAVLVEAATIALTQSG